MSANTTTTSLTTAILVSALPIKSLLPTANSTNFTFTYTYTLVPTSSSILTATLSSSLSSATSTAPAVAAAATSLPVLSRPYASKFAVLGVVPMPNPDGLVLVAFIFLYLIAAAVHMIIYQLNNQRLHKFKASLILFDFGLIRTGACIMRLVFCFHHNPTVALISAILNNVGVFFLLLTNLLLAQRLLRSIHPRLGWHGITRVVFRMYAISIPAVVIMQIVATIYTANTLDREILRRLGDLQLFGGTYFAVAACMPIIIVVLATIVQRIEAKVSGTRRPAEKFGEGSHAAKVAIILVLAGILSASSLFKIITAFLPMRPVDNPAWYQSIGPFYVVVYGAEVLSLILYALFRIDLRFHIPDGSKHPGDYSKNQGTNESKPASINAKGDAAMSNRDEKIEWFTTDDLDAQKNKGNRDHQRWANGITFSEMMAGELNELNNNTRSKSWHGRPGFDYSQDPKSGAHLSGTLTNNSDEVWRPESSRRMGHSSASSMVATLSDDQYLRSPTDDRGSRHGPPSIPDIPDIYRTGGYGLQPLTSNSTLIVPRVRTNSFNGSPYRTVPDI